jgi:DNA repair protein RadC
MKTTIRNIELKVKRVAVSEGTEPYGASVRSPNDVARIAQSLIGDSAQEMFLVFILDVKNRLVGFHEASRGSIDSCPVDPRMVFRPAVALGASGFVAVHNHPSGDKTPSTDDIILARRLKEAGELLGIQLLDHVIVSDSARTSLLERGLL